MVSSQSFLCLPAEILVAIICQSSDIHSLRNLVVTCRTVYDIYTENKLDVLARTLHQIIHVLNGVAVDADACATADDLDFSQNEDNDTIFESFVNTYRKERARRFDPNQHFQNPERIFFPLEETPNFVTKSIETTPLVNWPTRSPDRLCRLCKRHMLMEKCVARFRKRTLTTPEHGTTNEMSFARLAPLSRTERRRIYRALYRLEMYNLLFRTVRDAYFIRVKYDSRYWFWLSIFSSYELDEIATVHQWLCDEWYDLLPNLKGIAQERWAKWSFWQSQWLIRGSLLEKGTPFLLQVLDQNITLQLKMVQDVCGEDEPEQDIGSLLVNMGSVREQYSSRGSDDGFPESGSRLTFEGDHPDCPNAAWIWSAHYRMTMHCYDHKDADLRRIGYVMWDQGRLKHWPIYDAPRWRSRTRMARER